jgi:hypothetical protein
MFAGHAALAFAARRSAPDTSLGTLVAASYGLDLVWPFLVLAGVERLRVDPGNTAFTPLDFQWYPWSHSLLMSLAWAVLAGLGVWAFSRRTRDALVVSALVMSHWVLDFLTHRPDLPLWPGEGAPMAGLGLWNSVAGTYLVEGTLFAFCVLLYVRSTRPTSAIGSAGMWSFLGLIALIWVIGPFGPPPPSETAVAAVALAVWIFPVWAWWFDRHREPKA